MKKIFERQRDRLDFSSERLELNSVKELAKLNSSTAKLMKSFSTSEKNIRKTSIAYAKAEQDADILIKESLDVIRKSKQVLSDASKLAKDLGVNVSEINNYNDVKDNSDSLKKYISDLKGLLKS